MRISKSKILEDNIKPTVKNLRRGYVLLQAAVERKQLGPYCRTPLQALAKDYEYKAARAIQILYGLRLGFKLNENGTITKIKVYE